VIEIEPDDMFELNGWTNLVIKDPARQNVDIHSIRGQRLLAGGKVWRVVGVERFLVNSDVLNLPITLRVVADGADSG
jgi:hypothetical protein